MLPKEAILAHLPVIQHRARFHDLEKSSDNALVFLVLNIFNGDPSAQPGGAREKQLAALSFCLPRQGPPPGSK